MDKVSIIKIGGDIIDNPERLDDFLHKFTRLRGRRILIHGGGVMASQLCRTLGIEPVMIDGRRVTDRGTLTVAAMVYAGWINKDVVARLQALGCDALGLSGADGNSIEAVRRLPGPVDFGYVGDVSPGKVNTPFIGTILDSGIVPVFCAITHDGRGSLLNTNADSVASALAAAMASTGLYRVELVYCFEKKGVLADSADDNSALDTITPADYARMKATGAVKAGMIAKLDTAFAAMDQGVARVVIKHSSDILTDRGTVLKQ